MSSGAAPAPSRKARSRRGRKTPRRRLDRWGKHLDRWRKRLGWTWRTLRVAPPAIRGLAVAAVVLAVFAAADIVYQVIRKPTEMFFPVSGALNKMPAETWRQYESLFRRYSTATIPPELLAALAQAEGAGNPVARTYWRWRLTWRPFGIYQPASSAVGMYQMTDAAFADARRYCIRHHTVIEVGDWNDWDSCWLTGLYTRVVPSNAVELASALLDRKVAAILGRRQTTRPSPQQAQDLAVMVHLCGSGPAAAFARRGFRLAPGERCGDHDAAAYLAQVNALKRHFLRLAAEQ